MPETSVLHYNPPESVGKTRCGRTLAKVKRWTTDPHDATCNTCVRLIAKDKHIA